MIRSDVDVAGVADGDASLTAALGGVGTRSLVLAPSALRLEVAQHVLPEVRPVRHGTVPRAVRKWLGQRRDVVKREPETESSGELQTTKVIDFLHCEAGNVVNCRSAELDIRCSARPSSKCKRVTQLRKEAHIITVSHSVQSR